MADIEPRDAASVNDTATPQDSGQDENVVLMPNRAEALRFLKALDPTAERFCFSTLDDMRDTDAGVAARKEVVTIQHGSLDEVWSSLTALNSKNAGVFVSVNAMWGDRQGRHHNVDTRNKAAHPTWGREHGDATTIRCVIADWDKPHSGISAIDNFQKAYNWRKPHLVVESSPGKRHAYWLVSNVPSGPFKANDATTNSFQSICSKIIGAFHSDTQVKDLTRVLRIPGFIHCKKGTRATTILLEVNDHAPYDWNEFRDATKALVVSSSTADGEADNDEFAPATSFDDLVAKMAALEPGRRNGGLLKYAMDAVMFVSQEVVSRDEAETRVVDAAVRSGLSVDEAIDVYRRGRSYAEKRLPPSGVVWRELDIHGNPRRNSEVNCEDVLLYMKRKKWINFYYDKWRHSPILNGNPATSGDIDNVGCGEAGPKLGVHARAEMWNVAFRSVVQTEAFNPVTRYRQSLVWDGRPRLNYLFPHYLGSENTEVYRTCGRLLMLASIAKVEVPEQIGHRWKWHTVPILGGKQGDGKSTALRILGGPWHSDASIIHATDKEQAELTDAVTIFEIAELVAFDNANNNKIKAFLTRSHSKLRRAYERNKTEVPIMCVFVGSTNESAYLTDGTGNRRFLPTPLLRPCKAENRGATEPTPGCPDYLRSLEEDVDLLWAEAQFEFNTLNAAGGRIEWPESLHIESGVIQDRHVVHGAIDDLLKITVPSVVCPKSVPRGCEADAKGRMFAMTTLQFIQSHGDDLRNVCSGNVERAVKKMFERNKWEWSNKDQVFVRNILPGELDGDGKPVGFGFKSTPPF